MVGLVQPHRLSLWQVGCRRDRRDRELEASVLPGEAAEVALAEILAEVAEGREEVQMETSLPTKRRWVTFQIP